MLEALLRITARELDVAKVSVKQITKITVENHEQALQNIVEIDICESGYMCVCEKVSSYR